MHSLLRRISQSASSVTASEMGWTTRAFVPQKNKLASLLLMEYPMNVWKQSETRHNELLNHEWMLVRKKCAMLHYATCDHFHAACVAPQECTMKVQEGKFKLQDLLVVPMQRVLKYHLLLKVRAISRNWSHFYTVYSDNGGGGGNKGKETVLQSRAPN